MFDFGAAHFYLCQNLFICRPFNCHKFVTKCYKIKVYVIEIPRKYFLSLFFFKINELKRFISVKLFASCPEVGDTSDQQMALSAGIFLKVTLSHRIITLVQNNQGNGTTSALNLHVFMC